MATAIVILAGLTAGYVGAGAGLAIGLAGATAMSRFASAGPARRRAVAWAVVCGAVAVRISLAVHGARSDVRLWSERAREGAPVPVTATVRLESVRPTGSDGWSVRGTALACRPGCRGAAIRWRWTGAPDPVPGARVRLTGGLRAHPVRAVPGARYPPRGLSPGSRRGVVLDPGIEPISGPRVPVLTSAGRHLRERIGARFGEAGAPLVTALLLGDRGDVDGAVVDAFATTGTLHLLAVSGLHVGFLAWALAFALRLVGAGPAARAAIALATLVGYAGIVGGRPSVVRATIMIGVVMAARVDERRVDPWQAWGVAGIAILGLRPLDVFGLGFALSFSAVAGLLALAGPVGRVLDRPVAEVPVVNVLAGGMVATTAASAGTLVVQSAAFGWIAPIGFAVNPLVVPVVGFALPLAWVALAFDAVGIGWIAGPLADAAGAALTAVAAIAVECAARVGPWAPEPREWLAAAGGSAVLAVALARRRPAAGVLVAAAAVALVLAARPPRSPAWEITWLDVGQGDAIVVRFPGGATWLIDAGPADPHGDAGLRVVLPWLRRRGVDSIERLVTTHPDLDHVGGASSVLRGIDVDAWSSGGVVASGGAYLALLAGRGRDGPPEAELVRAGTRWTRDGIAIDVLHPSPGWVASDPYAARVNANEGSVVLLMRGGPCRALLTGDLGRPGESALVEALGDSLRAELLHVGHHGSRHSSTARFLARVRPRQAVASVGRTNRHGHPHPDALERLAGAGARIWRTDREGAITARCGPIGWRLSSAAP